MELAVVRIGNSRGIRIPKILLARCHIEKSVEASVDGNTILLSPKRKPRTGWAKAAQTAHQKREDKLLLDDTLEETMAGDWKW